MLGFLWLLWATACILCSIPIHLSRNYLKTNCWHGSQPKALSSNFGSCFKMLDKNYIIKPERPVLVEARVLWFLADSEHASISIFELRSSKSTIEQRWMCQKKLEHCKYPAGFWNEIPSYLMHRIIAFMNTITSSNLILGEHLTLGKDKSRNVSFHCNTLGAMTHILTHLICHVWSLSMHHTISCW